MELENNSRSISSNLASLVRQHRCTATSISNAELRINEVNARLELLSLQVASQDPVETVTRTSVSFRLLPLTFSVERVSLRRKPIIAAARRTKAVITVHLPNWFLEQQYAIQLRRAVAGWSYSMAVHRVVPIDCELFKACRDGDDVTIKSLLSSKQASIYDRTADGTSAFTFAVTNGHLTVCRLLRHAGFFAQAQPNDYWTALHALEKSMNDFTEHHRSLLSTIAGCDTPERSWLLEHTREWNGPLSYTEHADWELLLVLTRAHHQTALLKLSDLRAYYEARYNVRFKYKAFMPFNERILSHDQVIYEIALAPHQYAWIVYGMAHEVARGFHNGERYEQWSQSVYKVLCAVVRAGLKPHHTQGALESPWVRGNWYEKSTATPLGMLCVEATRSMIVADTVNERRKKVKARLRAWITGLYIAGVDLVQYAEQEASVFRHDLYRLRIPWKRGFEGELLISTGRGPEDWDIEIWDQCEGYARLFWLIIEETPIMPDLIMGILETHPLAAELGLSHCDMPGAWQGDLAQRVEDLERHLGWETDQVLANIGEDLTMLDYAAFLVKWGFVTEILGR